MKESKSLALKLNNVMVNGKPDFEKIEFFLQHGANPLAPFSGGSGDCVLESLFLESTDSKRLRENMPKLVQLFIDNGMNPANITVDNHSGMAFSPLWALSFLGTKETIETVKILIENGLKSDVLESYISHFYMDAEMCDGSDMDNNKFKNHVTNNLKAIMLAASYPDMLSSSEYLRSCIEMDTTNLDNKYNLCRFRDYDAFIYEYDLSTCDNIPNGLRNTTVRIYEKNGTEPVWTMSI